jgi:hypothetical protein
MVPDVPVTPQGDDSQPALAAHQPYGSSDTHELHAAGLDEAAPEVELQDPEIIATFDDEFVPEAPVGFGDEPTVTAPADHEDAEIASAFGEAAFELPPAFSTEPVFETDSPTPDVAPSGSAELDLGEPISRPGAEHASDDASAVDFDALWAEAVPPTEEEAAATLFGATASLQEDPALDARLAEASADDPDSLDALFAALPTGTPARGATPVPPAPPVTPARSQSFSFDQFFEESDLAEFHSWLSGLKKQ